MKRLLATCLLGLLTYDPAGAQRLEDYDYEDLELRGLGVEIAGVRPADMLPAASFGVRADLGLVGPRVRISPAVRYWSSSLRDEEVARLAQQILRICDRQATGSCPPGLDLGEIRRSDLELSADAHFLFPTGYPVEPYLGSGVGIHVLNGRGEVIDDTFVEDLLDSVSPALNLLGGVQALLGTAVQLMVEARFVLVSDVRYASVALGGTWTLPSGSGNAFGLPSFTR